jgi:hypothetical protein
LRLGFLDEKKAVLGPRVVKPETDNIAAGIDVVRFTGSAVGYVEELERAVFGYTVVTQDNY